MNGINAISQNLTFGGKGGSAHIIRRLFLILPLFLIFCVLSVHAQERYLGGLLGTVSDTSGAKIIGATVTATDNTTHFASKAVTNSSGSYSIPFLTPDTYTVTVEANGFGRETQTGIVLTADSSLAVNFTLKVGASTETVTVTATAPLLDTASASLGTTFTEQQAAQLPNQGRVPFMVAALAAGAYDATYLTGTPEATLVPYGGGPTATTMNGISGHTHVDIDGSPDDPQERSGTTGSGTYTGFTPSPESVQEVKSETAPYDAEVGGGAGDTDLILRSGTNAIHGAAYYVFQNTYLNANFAQRVPTQDITGASATPRTNGTWNQPGGVLAGPVRIAHVYNGRDKTFFMVAYEHLEQHGHTANGIDDLVPLPAMATGDFSSLCPGGFNASTGVCVPGGGVQIYDPLTLNAGNNRTPFPKNQIPSGRFNPVGAALLKYYPAPNSTLSSVVNYISANSVVPETYWSFVTRVDQSINQNNKFFATFYKENLAQVQSIQGFPLGIGPTGTGSLVYRNNVGGSLDYISILPRGFLADTRFGIIYHPFGDYLPVPSFDLSKIGMSPAGLAYQTFPGTSFSDSYAGLQASSGGQFSEATVGTIDVVISKAIQKHNLRFGFEGYVDRYNVVNPESGLGTFAFDRLFTQQNSINTADGKDPNSGNAIASLLLGYPTSGSYQLEAYPAIQQQFQAYFIQDDWRAAAKLTLNIGLRWEDQLPYTERTNALDTGFCTTCTNPLQTSLPATSLVLHGGLQFASPTNRGMYNSELSDWQPRFGVSYQLTPRIVLHSGFGTAYFTTVDGLENYGYTAVTNYADTVDGTHPATSFASPFPGGVTQPSGSSLGLGTNIGSSLSFNASNYQRPRMMLYSASAQAQLPLNMTLQVAYAGNRVWDFEASKNINSLPAQYLLSPTTASYAAQQANVTALQTAVTNPMAGLIPTDSTINGKTIQQQYLDLPFPEFGTLTEINIPSGGYLYNALQVTVNKPMGHDVSVLGTFNWNHEMDSTQYLNATDANPERWQDGSPTLIGNLAVIYRLPVFSAMPRYGREIRRLAGQRYTPYHERPPGWQSGQRYLAIKSQAGKP